MTGLDRSKQGELRFYRVRGMRLAYHVYGDPGGRPLLCLHGFMDHGASFRFVAEHLSDVCIIAPDVRGHGHSDWVGPGGYYHFYDYFDDVRALLAELGWSRFSLVGHSMGGSIAVAIAALEPDKVDSVVLLEGMGPPFADLDDTVGRIDRWSSALRRPAYNASPEQRRAARTPMRDVSDAASRLKAVNSRLPDARAVALAETMTEPAAAGSGVVWRYDPLHRTPSAKPYLRAEAEAIWRRIRAPVLSLSGTESNFRLEDLERRHQTFVRLVAGEIEAAGHNMHHDQPAAVAKAVAGWISERGHLSVAE